MGKSSVQTINDSIMFPIPNVKSWHKLPFPTTHNSDPYPYKFMFYTKRVLYQNAFGQRNHLSYMIARQSSNNSKCDSSQIQVGEQRGYQERCMEI